MAALCFLLSCDDVVLSRVKDPEKQPTQISIDLTSTESRDGVRTYRMQTPLMERYELAKVPFSEFRKGIHVETFNDSTGLLESELTADYARLDEVKEIWEARGNVVGRNHSDDKTLYTEQLFWDQKLDKIYSDKRVRVLDGRDKHVGMGFESDGGFNAYTFRKPQGRMEMHQDSTDNDEANGELSGDPMSGGAVPSNTVPSTDPNDPRYGLPVVSNSRSAPSEPNEIRRSDRQTKTKYTSK